MHSLKMTNKVKLVMMALIGELLLSGCAHNPFTAPKPDDPEYAPVVPHIPPPPNNYSGAIYQPGYELVLYEDDKARGIGDVITVVFDESTNAVKKADTTINKKSDTSITNPTILGELPQLSAFGGNNFNLGFELEGDRKFSGNGDVKQSNQLQGKVSVTVMDVMPNGNLVVKGEKWVTLNHGDEFIRLSGIVRQSDIAPDNTVLSSRLANARIAYAGKGDAANSNKMGWLDVILMSPLWLF